jgi:hypothetical protein
VIRPAELHSRPRVLRSGADPRSDHPVMTRHPTVFTTGVAVPRPRSAPLRFVRFAAVSCIPRLTREPVAGVIGVDAAFHCHCPSAARCLPQLTATTAHRAQRTAETGDITARSGLLRDAKFSPIPTKK